MAAMRVSDLADNSELEGAMGTFGTNGSDEAKAAAKRKAKQDRKKARTPEEKAAKQARARARRKARERDKAISILYKPLEEWDAEELARGKPRSADGSFRGPAPAWINAAVHEEAIKRFKDISQSDLRALVPTALDTVKMIMTSEATDDKDRPLVPAGVKLDAAKWTIEHLVGKPTQRQELDISVKLQGVLAAVMVGPDEQGQLGMAMDTDAWDVEDAEVV